MGFEGFPGNGVWVKKMMWGRETYFFMFFEHKWDPQISLFLFVLMGVRKTFHSWNYISPKYHWPMWDFFIVFRLNWDHLLFGGQIDTLLIVCMSNSPLTLMAIFSFFHIMVYVYTHIYIHNIKKNNFFTYVKVDAYINSLNETTM